MTRCSLWLRTVWQMGPTVDYNFLQTSRQRNINTPDLRTSFFKSDVPRAARYLHSGGRPHVWYRLTSSVFLGCTRRIEKPVGGGVVWVGKRADSCLFRAPRRVWTKGEKLSRGASKRWGSRETGSELFPGESRSSLGLKQTPLTAHKALRTPRLRSSVSAHMMSVFGLSNH